jgi:hypothetical protein
LGIKALPLASVNRIPHSRHRGQAGPKLFLLACGLVGFGIFKLLDSPALKLAQARAQDQSTSQQRAFHAEFVSTLDKLIEHSVEVLSIHHRGSTPYEEIVLWRDDSKNPGVIDPEEIALVSHSPLLGTMTVYTLVGTAERANALSASNTRSGNAGESRSAARAIFSSPLTRDAVAHPSFCDRWRAHSKVRPQVIATGLSDLRVEALGPKDHELSLLRLWLRWDTKLSDGAEEISVLINAEKGGQPATVIDQ